jgi:hypothetical protein
MTQYKPEAAEALSSLCLSQIKSGHICDVVRRGSDGTERVPLPRRHVISARPYPRTGACASHYSSLGRNSS